MSVTPNGDFAEYMTRLAAEVPPFEPMAYYDPDGDCIEFIAKPDPFYAERVDGLVTVYRSFETGEIVGSLIKGVRRLHEQILKSTPGFRIEIKEGRVRLVHVFLARLQTLDAEPHDPSTLTYKKLIQMAEDSQVEAELCVA